MPIETVPSVSHQSRSPFRLKNYLKENGHKFILPPFILGVGDLVTNWLETRIAEESIFRIGVNILQFLFRPNKLVEKLAFSGWQKQSLWSLHFAAWGAIAFAVPYIFGVGTIFVGVSVVAMLMYEVIYQVLDQKVESRNAIPVSTTNVSASECLPSSTVSDDKLALGNQSEHGDENLALERKTDSTNEIQKKQQETITIWDVGSHPRGCSSVSDSKSNRSAEPTFMSPATPKSPKTLSSELDLPEPDELEKKRDEVEVIYDIPPPRLLIKSGRLAEVISQKFNLEELFPSSNSNDTYKTHTSTLQKARQYAKHSMEEVSYIESEKDVNQASIKEPWINPFAVLQEQLRVEEEKQLAHSLSQHLTQPKRRNSAILSVDHEKLNRILKEAHTLRTLQKSNEKLVFKAEILGKEDITYELNSKQAADAFIKHLKDNKLDNTFKEKVNGENIFGYIEKLAGRTPDKKASGVSLSSPVTPVPAASESLEPKPIPSETKISAYSLIATSRQKKVNSNFSNQIPISAQQNGGEFLRRLSGGKVSTLDTEELGRLFNVSNGDRTKISDKQDIKEKQKIGHFSVTEHRSLLSSEISSITIQGQNNDPLMVNPSCTLNSLEDVVAFFKALRASESKSGIGTISGKFNAGSGANGDLQKIINFAIDQASKNPETFLQTLNTAYDHWVTELTSSTVEPSRRQEILALAKEFSKAAERVAATILTKGSSIEVNILLAKEKLDKIDLITPASLSSSWTPALTPKLAMQNLPAQTVTLPEIETLPMQVHST